MPAWMHMHTYFSLLWLLFLSRALSLSLSFFIFLCCSSPLFCCCYSCCLPLFATCHTHTDTHTHTHTADTWADIEQLLEIVGRFPAASSRCRIPYARGVVWFRYQVEEKCIYWGKNHTIRYNLNDIVCIWKRIFIQMSSKYSLYFYNIIYKKD